MPPNPIDFDMVFSNLSFAKNPTLYVTQIVICVIYVAAVIWARRQDKRDVTKVTDFDEFIYSPNSSFLQHPSCTRLGSLEF